MKKYYILVLFAIVSNISSAQLLKLGGKIGLGSSEYSFDELRYENDQTSTFMRVMPNGSVTAFKIGATGSVKLPLLPIGARMDVLYSNIGGDVVVQDALKNTSITYTEKSSRLDIPMDLVFHISKIRIFGGATFSLDMNRSTEIADVLHDTYVVTDQFDFGVVTEQQNYWNWNFGIGVAFKKMALDVMVETPMKENLSFNSSQNTYNFGPNPEVVTFSFSYFII